MEFRNLKFADERNFHYFNEKELWVKIEGDFKSFDKFPKSEQRKFREDESFEVAIAIPDGKDCRTKK